MYILVFLMAIFWGATDCLAISQISYTLSKQREAERAVRIVIPPKSQKVILLTELRRDSLVMKIQSRNNQGGFECLWSPKSGHYGVGVVVGGVAHQNSPGAV